MRKICIAFAMFILILMFFSTNILAISEENDFDVEQGDYFILEFKINLQNSSNIVYAEFDYDKNIFEELNNDDITLQGDWNSFVFNKDTSKIIIDRNDESKGLTNVFSVKFKVKSSANLCKTSIKIKNISYTDGIKISSCNDEIYSVNVKERAIHLGYNIKDDKYIVNVKAKTPVENFIKILKNSNELLDVKIYKNSLEITSGYVSSGMKVDILDTSKNEEKSFLVSVLGDINGDGLVNVIDYSYIKASCLEVLNFNELQTISADIDKNDKIDIKDKKLILYHRALIKGYILNYQ